MKCSFGMSDFLEEIPSLSHSVVFLYFFALIDEEGFLISTNETSGGDGMPVELFQILKDDAMKVLHSVCQQIWKNNQVYWLKYI